MTERTNTDGIARRQSQPGTCRPVEPGNHVMTWPELDDLLNTVRQANEIVHGLHMMAECAEIDGASRSSIQTVAQVAIGRLNGAEASLMGYCDLVKGK